MGKFPLFPFWLLFTLLELLLPPQLFPLPTRDPLLSDKASAVIDRQVVSNSPTEFALAIHRDRDNLDKKGVSIGKSSAYFTPLDSIKLEIPPDIYIKFSYINSTIEERIAESYYAELEIEKTDERIKAIRKELEDLRKKELIGSDFDKLQHPDILPSPEKDPKVGSLSSSSEEGTTEAEPPSRSEAYGGLLSRKGQKRGIEGDTRANWGADELKEETFCNRAIGVFMRVVGFVFNHPILVLSLLILYALLADLIGKRRGWGEK